MIINGPPFSGTDFGTYLKVNDISHKPIPPKWPRANGLVETFNKPILRAIRTAHTEGRNWRRELYNFLLNYRATPHTTTGLPPAELLFHRKIRIKLPHYSPTLDTHAMENSARTNDLIQKIKNKNYTDTRTHATKSVIKVGNHVLVQQDKTNKFSTRFDPRPYLVTARPGCLLVLEGNGKHLKRNVAHCKIIPN